MDEFCLIKFQEIEEIFAYFQIVAINYIAFKCFT